MDYYCELMILLLNYCCQHKYSFRYDLGCSSLITLQSDSWYDYIMAKFYESLDFKPHLFTSNIANVCSPSSLLFVEIFQWLERHRTRSVLQVQVALDEHLPKAICCLHHPRPLSFVEDDDHSLHQHHLPCMFSLLSSFSSTYVFNMKQSALSPVPSRPLLSCLPTFCSLILLGEQAFTELPPTSSSRFVCCSFLLDDSSGGLSFH